MSTPLISICIPAYERAAYLERLLESIGSQTFRDFEVVVSDDSRNDQVRQLLDSYKGNFPIVYHRNEQSLGTPENWNSAMAKANGTWIKLMHDDDWFARPDALAEFAAATKKGVDFIWCYYNAVYDSGKVVPLKYKDGVSVGKNPFQLFSTNVVGPPSAVMVRKSSGITYDKRLKWLVDIDYYIREIGSNGEICIPKWLVNFGYNDSQVTNSCYLNRAVEIPESLILYQKHGEKLRSTPELYNAWWRLIRNLEIREIAEAEEFKGSYEIPPFLAQIIERQSRIPKQLLQIGPVSRMLMFASYLTARH